MKKPNLASIVIGVSFALLVAVLLPTRNGQTEAATHNSTTARQRLAALENAAARSHRWHQLNNTSDAMRRAPEIVPSGRVRRISGQHATAADATAEKAFTNSPNPVQDRLPDGHVLINGAPAHPRRLVARLAEGVDAAQLRQLLGKNGSELLNNPTSQDGLSVIQTPEAEPGTSSSVNLQTQAKALQESGLVEFAEPDYLVNVSATPSDYGFQSGWLWGLRNTGRWGTSGIDIGAEDAWDITTGSRDIIVAIIDTGIRATHLDLAANMWVNPDEIADNGVDDDGDGLIDNMHGIDAVNNDGDPDDDHSHGTHVAGTIGASANDGNLCVGVAWNVQLMACKFMDRRGYGYSSDAVRCIDFAVSNGARILNCSWGSWGSSEAIRDALARAGESGVLCVAAAGNSGANTDDYPHYPSGYALDSIIAVGAVDLNGNRASWSNYGEVSVDVFAPGVSILSSTAWSDQSYSFWSGTSMAAPHISGIAALMLANDPALTVSQIKSGILNTSTLLGSLSGLSVSGGLANANNALQGGGDGELELELTASETPMAGGQSVLFFARVTDVDPVTDATLTGTAGETSLSFADDGTGGDATSGDAIYTAAFPAPSDTSVSQLTVTVTATAPGKTGATVTADFAVLHPPANDDFADRIVITGNRVRFSGGNLGASAEEGEPRHYYWAAQRSVWYEWTASFTGIAMATTRGSSFDTVMAVYTGNELGRLRARARDDDRGGNLTSRVWFWARAGTTYHIAIDGYRGDEGQIKGQVRLTRPWWWRWYRR